MQVYDTKFVICGNICKNTAYISTLSGQHIVMDTIHKSCRIIAKPNYIHSNKPVKITIMIIVSVAPWFPPKIQFWREATDHGQRLLQFIAAEGQMFQWVTGRF